MRRNYPKKGRPSLIDMLTDEQLDEVLRRRLAGDPIRSIARDMGHGYQGMAKVVRELERVHANKFRDRDADPIDDAKQLASMAGMKAAVVNLMHQKRMTPQEAASRWLSVLDNMAEAAVKNLERRHDPRYDGIPELGYSKPTYDEANDWVASAAAEAEYSFRDVQQMAILLAKLHMDMMPYFHAKVAAVEPNSKPSELESMSPADRRERLRALMAEAAARLTQEGQGGADRNTH